MKSPTSNPHADHHLHVAAGVILFLIVVLLVIAGGAYLANQIWSPETQHGFPAALGSAAS